MNVCESVSVYVHHMQKEPAEANEDNAVLESGVTVVTCHVGVGELNPGPLQVQ